MDNVQKFLLAAVLGLLGVLAFMYARSPRAAKNTSPLHRPTYLITGPTGAGKTALYYSLTQEPAAATVSSLEPNVAQLALPFASAAIRKSYQLIDFPGHMKYSQLLHKLVTEDVTVAKLKGVVFVLDSSSACLGSDEKVAAVAKSLFHLLSLTEKVPNGVDYLVAVNKQDLFDSRPVHKVRQVLEHEIGKLVAGVVGSKGTGSGGSGIDNDDDESDFQKEESTRDFWRAVVGSSPFSFDLLEGGVEFVGGSVTKGAVSNWQNWFDEKAVNYGGI